VFQELPTVFNCSVLTFGVQKSSIVNKEPRVRCKLVSEVGFAMEEENTTVDYRTFQRTSKRRVPAKRNDVEDQLERSISAVCQAGGA
jgi:hypothetical protein